jgi:hypothetical protein
LLGAYSEDQVLAGGALHGALHHLDVAADAVLLVHDDVAGAELERGRRRSCAGSACAC